MWKLTFFIEKMFILLTLAMSGLRFSTFNFETLNISTLNYQHHSLFKPNSNLEWLFDMALTSQHE